MELAFVKRLFLCAGVLFAVSAPALAQDVKGIWLSESGETRVKIAECGSSLCGTITWLKNPRKDTENEKESLRSRDLVGTRMMYDIKPNGTNAWAGKLYNITDGKTYTGKMETSGDSSLKLSGCVLGGLICKSQTWSRVN